MGRSSPAEAKAVKAIARLKRIAQARSFSANRFRRSLEAATDVPRPVLLQRFLADWAGVSLSDAQAVEVFEQIERVHEGLGVCLGGPVSLLTAMVHELHTRRGLLADPQLVLAKDLDVLRRNASIDPLTGLHNRSVILQHLERELSGAKRRGAVVSVIVMDLLGLERVSQRLGHGAGDNVLKRTARCIQQSLRAIDVGCRYGAGEFIAVLPNTDLVDGLAAAERIRLGVSRIRLRGAGAPKVSLFYGVATYPSDGSSLDLLKKAGDQRLLASRPTDDFVRWKVRRRYPRFPVSGVQLELQNRSGPATAIEVTDIGFGGLSFIHTDLTIPPEIEAEVVQRFSPNRHRVAMKPVSAIPVGNEQMRIGCAYVQ